MVRSFKFASTPEIHFGTGVFNQLPDLIERYGKHVFILTGARSFNDSPFYHTFIDVLEKRDFKYEKIGISEEPSPMLIDGLTSKFRRYMPDVVVSIGGGSVIDAGKAFSAMLPELNSIYEYIEGVGRGKEHSGEKVPFIAVPTTAGTGSETTKNAVLSDIGKTGFKRSIRHNNFVPDIAVVDPELTMTCPARVTAACGLDAFTQLLEAFVSLNGSAMTDALAYSGLENVINSLLRAYNNPADLDARTGMSYAALVSGLVLANSGLGVVHGFASVVGGYHNIPHGVVCGSLLAAATRKNIEKLSTETPDSIVLDKYRKVGMLFNDTPRNGEKDPLDILIENLDDWTKKLEISRFSDYGMTRKDISRIIEETGLKNNPVDLDRSDLEEILTERI